MSRERSFYIIRTAVSMLVAILVAFVIILLVSDQPVESIKTFLLAPFSSKRYLGNIVEITQASALYANPMHPYTQALLSAIPIPDPEVEEKKQRIRLEGELPSPVDPPEGCRFINRCRFASERCRKERPELLEMEPGHLVACHYCEEMKKGTVG